MKKITLLLVAIISIFQLNAQKKVSVLGDSYSTFGGYVSPESNLCWYNGADKRNAKNDVEKVEETWWYQLIEDCGMQLERNNSYSGATICCRGYSGNDFSDRTYLARLNNLGNPDIILVFGGTNDSWSGAEPGEFRYSGWIKKDLFNFRPAFAYMLDRLTSLYPSARIINITNSDLRPEIAESMDIICNHYGVENIKLHDIDKQSGHPSIAGMKTIAEQVKAVLNK